MKSKWKVCLALGFTLVIMGSLLSGCDKSKKEAAADSKAIKLKFAHHNPPTALVCKNGFEPWIKAVEAKSGGKVKIDTYPSSTLGKPQDAYDMVLKGVADITWGYIGYFPGRFPLSEVMNLPMLGIDTASVGSHAIWDLYSNSPYLKKEFADVKVLTLHTHDGAPITSKKPLHNLADLAGKKLRSPGGPVIPMVQALGASPMAMPAPDTYQAAEKGVIDGAVMAWEAVEMLNLQEVLKNALDANVMSGTFFLIMNKKTWDSLPPEVQKAFDEESGEKASQLFAKGGWDDTKKMSTDKFIKAGGKISTLDPAEAAKWREKAKGVWERWAAELEAKGLPGKAVLADAIKAIEKFKK